jgi:hypothetical protein
VFSEVRVASLQFHAHDFKHPPLISHAFGSAKSAKQRIRRSRFGRAPVVYPKNNCPEVSACQDAPWFIFPLKGIPTHPGKTNEPGSQCRACRAACIRSRTLPPGGWYSYRPRPTRAVGCQNGSASPLKFVDVQNSPNLPNRGTMPASLALSLVTLATSAQVLSAPL